mgnify:CR=1 FL=1
MKVTRNNEMILSVGLTREEVEAAILQRLKQKYPSQILTELETVNWDCNDYGMEGVDFHFIKPKLELDESFEEL